MASITCPHCGVGLRLKSEVSSKRQIKCPKCAGTFTTEDEGTSSLPEQTVSEGLEYDDDLGEDAADDRDRDNYDDEYERPRRRRRRSRKRKSGNAVLLAWLCLAGVGLLVL